MELGTRTIWGNSNFPFGLSADDRRQHCYLIGKSGSGKTSLLMEMIIQALEAGEGLAVLDPHGDMAEELLQFIPPWRTDDVVYLDAADIEHPIGINPLMGVPANSRHLVVDGIVGAFRSIWGASWGVRMEYILANAIAALLECENVSLLSVPRMLADERYRQWVMKQVTDPMVTQFWTMEWASWDSRFRAEAISPVQNKIGQLLLAAPLRHMLGQCRSKVDARFMLDNRRVLIANLSKGRLGADKSNLLGSLLVTQFQLAAMGRADMPEEDRVPFSLFVDEFHNFTTSSFAAMLAEIRKYALAVIVCHQYIAQLTPEVRDAVFGNVATIISFRVGESDAAVLSREFGSDFTPNHFTDLENYQVCVKLLDGGVQRDPFLGRTLAPQRKRYGRGHNIRRRSREKYAVPRAVVEDKIRRWLMRK